MKIESKHLERFTEWLENELREKGKISMDDVLLSGAQEMNWTVDTAKKYLGKALIIRSGQIKLNLDESKGMKFLEYRKDFHYTGDRRKHEVYEGTEEKETPAQEEESEGENIYGMKHEGEESGGDKDSEEDIEKEE